MQGREFAWTDADFDRVQALIYQRAGISLHDGKHAMVYSRLSRRLRETGHQSFRDYLGWLENHDGPEWQEFVNALTTNLTSFFREQHHFEIFAEHLKSKPTGTPWRVWCSAASTGEEPYSIVVTALESIGTKGNFRLTASDIDSKVLATAAQAARISCSPSASRSTLDGPAGGQAIQLRAFVLQHIQPCADHTSAVQRVQQDRLWHGLPAGATPGH